MRLAHARLTTRRSLLATLLFLAVANLKRTWDLRTYSGDALALLSGRRRPYGYRHTERFLSELARSGGAENLTTALARWTAQLWPAPACTQQEGPFAPAYYIDGHHKAVYSDKLIPRSLVGKLSKVLGCRAQVVLHDTAGHPLLVTTARGDTHLTVGLPQIVARYEQATGVKQLKCIIVDREGMAAEFLAQLKAQQRTVVTLLRADQYQGESSFQDIGEFVPLSFNRAGQLTREVAPARFSLSRPQHPDEPLELRVALIRDLTRQVPNTLTQSEQEEAQGQRYQQRLKEPGWWEENWQAKAAPAAPSTSKLIPVVTTASELSDAVALAQLYFGRWPHQENSIKDWLLPVGLDTNHGYRKVGVVNSEVAKRREALTKRLANLDKWSKAARQASHNASRLYHRRYDQTKARAEELYRALNQRICEMEEQELTPSQQKGQIKALKEVADAEIAERQAKSWQAYDKSERESKKCQAYCREQNELLSKLEELNRHEREMLELDNAKDQVMSCLKVGLANVGMWVRDHYFPSSYANCGWERLAPFFQLGGWIKWEAERMVVELKPFNDRERNRELAELCERVVAAKAELPDGRSLVLKVQGVNRPVLEAQLEFVA